MATAGMQDISHSLHTLNGTRTETETHSQQEEFTHKKQTVQQREIPHNDTVKVFPAENDTGDSLITAGDVGAGTGYDTDCPEPDALGGKEEEGEDLYPDSPHHVQNGSRQHQHYVKVDMDYADYDADHSLPKTSLLNEDKQTSDVAEQEAPETHTQPVHVELSSSSPPSPPRFGVVSVWFALMGAQLLWSIFHVVGYITFQYISPVVVPSLRALIAVPCLFAFGYYKQGPTFYIVSLRDICWIALAALLGNALNQQLLNAGLSLTSASDVGLIVPSVPVITTILAILRKQEVATPGKILGIMVSTVGSLMIGVAEYYNGASNADSSAVLRVLGISLIFIQTCTWSGYLVVQRPILARGITVYAFTFYVFALGGICHLLLGLYWDIAIVNWSAIPWYIWFCVLYIGLGATVGAFLLFTYAATHLPASIMGMGALFSTIFSPVLGMLILGESLTLYHLLGGVFIAAGLIIVIHTKVQLDKLQKQQQAEVEPQQQQKQQKHRTDTSTVNNSSTAHDHQEEDDDDMTTAAQREDTQLSLDAEDDVIDGNDADVYDDGDEWHSSMSMEELEQQRGRRSTEKDGERGSEESQRER